MPIESRQKISRRLSLFVFGAGALAFLEACSKKPNDTGIFYQVITNGEKINPGSQVVNLGANNDLEALLRVEVENTIANAKLDIVLRNGTSFNPMMFSLPDNGEIVAKSWLDCVQFFLINNKGSYHFLSNVTEVVEPQMDKSLVEKGFNRRFKRYPLFEAKEIFVIGRNRLFLASGLTNHMSLVIEGPGGIREVQRIQRPTDERKEVNRIFGTRDGILQIILRNVSPNEGPYLKTRVWNGVGNSVAS